MQESGSAVGPILFDFTMAKGNTTINVAGSKVFQVIPVGNIVFYKTSANISVRGHSGKNSWSVLDLALPPTNESVMPWVYTLDIHTLSLLQ